MTDKQYREQRNGDAITIKLPDGPIKIKKKLYKSDIEAAIRILKKLAKTEDASTLATKKPDLLA